MSPPSAALAELIAAELTMAGGKTELEKSSKWLPDRRIDNSAGTWDVVTKVAMSSSRTCP